MGDYHKLPLKVTRGQFMVIRATEKQILTVTFKSAICCMYTHMRDTIIQYYLNLTSGGIKGY